MLRPLGHDGEEPDKGDRDGDGIVYNHRGDREDADPVEGLSCFTTAGGSPRKRMVVSPRRQPATPESFRDPWINGGHDAHGDDGVEGERR